MLIIFTGDGKGKTTSAIGQAMRAIGNGSAVLMVQLVKGPWESGEDTSCKKFGAKFKIVKKGRGFVKIMGDTLPIEEHEKAARGGLSYALEELATKKWNILIMDEVWNALGLDLLTDDEVHAFIDKALLLCDHLIMTGRGCPEEFIDRADLVTEMREVKHPFHCGVKAMQGVEY